MGKSCDFQAQIPRRLLTPAPGSPCEVGVSSGIQPLPAFLPPNLASQAPPILLSSGLGGDGPAWLLLESDWSQHEA